MIETIKNYLNERNTELVSKKGKMNAASEEIERNLRESEGMTFEQFTQYLVTRRDHIRNLYGKANVRGIEIDLTLLKMQELDSTITNESIYYKGKEFYPHGHNVGVDA
jgi:hypothetical protein